MLSEKEVLAEMVRLIENAGLLNLINGVQLGATSWYVKMSDCMESAKAVLAEREGAQEKTARCCQYGYFGDGHKCAKEQPAGDVAKPPLRVQGGTLQNFKDACTAPISQESAKKMVQLAIAERDAQWEKAIIEESYNLSDGMRLMGRSFCQRIRARLAQADKPRNQVNRILARAGVKGISVIDAAAEIIAELEKAQ
jgi:hypothetical protein